ncbi:B12-binding domain-containing radical SAM protein, partial [bacterium]|nr:B12-binding domain-containing radical SAM protein [bacterium]MBU1894590.1 B12-binding domain-containing radical SAM protein [Candidatus Omnitrophota bacterium]
YLIKKEKPLTKIILGGPQASLAASEIISNFQGIIDVVARGESENNIIRIVDSLLNNKDLSSIPGITFSKLGNVNSNQDLDLIDLDSLPKIDYSFVDIKRYQHDNVQMSVEAGRGCPFNCTFCSTSVLWKRKYRMKSEKKLYSDIKLATETFFAKNISLIHDNFTFRPDFVFKFCKYLIERNSRFTWTCASRADHLDRKLARIMYQAGCREIFFGIESGSQKIQKTTRKNIKTHKVVQTLKDASEEGIVCTASFIIGHLGETIEDFNHTLDLMIDLKRNAKAIIQIHILAPHSGTQVYQDVKSQLELVGYKSHLASVEKYQNQSNITELIKQNPSVFPSFYQFNRIDFSLDFLNFVQNIGYTLINYYERCFCLLNKHLHESYYETLWKLYKCHKKSNCIKVDQIILNLGESLQLETSQILELKDIVRYDKGIQNVSEVSMKSSMNYITINQTKYKLKYPVIINEKNSCGTYYMFVSRENNIDTYEVDREIFDCFVTKKTDVLSLMNVNHLVEQNVLLQC